VALREVSKKILQSGKRIQTLNQKRKSAGVRRP